MQCIKRYELASPCFKSGDMDRKELKVLTVFLMLWYVFAEVDNFPCEVLEEILSRRSVYERKRGNSISPLHWYCLSCGR